MIGLNAQSRGGSRIPSRYFPGPRDEVFKETSPTGITLRCGRWPWQKLRIAEELLAYHLATFGATGRGKSTIFREVLHQVQARDETAVIYDPKGEFRDEFYLVERGDVILDPTDERCPYWELEGEAKDEAQATP